MSDNHRELAVNQKLKVLVAAAAAAALLYRVFCAAIFSSAAGLQPVKLIVLVIDACLDIVILFSNRCSSYSFCPIVTKLVSNNVQKTVE